MTAISISPIIRPPAEPPPPAAPNDIPPEVFPIPAGAVTYEQAGSIIFSTIAPHHRIFIRDNCLCEVTDTPAHGAVISPLEPERFVAMLDSFGHKVKRREEQKIDGVPTHIWRKANMPIGHAKTLAETDAARNMLPKISRVLSAPVLIDAGNQCTETLQKGYHAHGGGTLITKGGNVPHMSLSRAVELLRGLLEDFNFASPADASRAMASFISPALKFGELLEADFPLDLAEADQSQSGKTYRQKIVCAIYNEIPSAITQPKGGVGSLDEGISSALIRGRPFVTIDNLRSRLDSQILESAIRGQGVVDARALRTRQTIETKHYLWQISTNGAELTRDAANRCLVVKITKRPPEARFKVFPEGDLLAHVKANQPLFLGAVFAILREWIHAGKPRTDDARHDFREWTQSMDFIVKEILKMPPLLDGHREEQLRTANPNLQWLRTLALSIAKNGIGDEFNASQLADLAEDEGIDLPRRNGSKDEPKFVVGRIMAKVFSEAEADEITVDGITISRTEREALNSAGNWKPTKFYTFARSSPYPPCSP